MHARAQLLSLPCGVAHRLLSASLMKEELKTIDLHELANVTGGWGGRLLGGLLGRRRQQQTGDTGAAPSSCGSGGCPSGNCGG